VLVLHIKCALHADGKDIRNYVEADQIDELFHWDIEERTGRECEHSSPSTPDLALKPNPHPYAIKTTYTALLPCSNSSGHDTPSKYFYIPSTGASSYSSTKHAHEYRGHRYSTSLIGKLSSPLPSPLPSPMHLQCSESDNDTLALSLPQRWSRTWSPFCNNSYTGIETCAFATMVAEAL